MQLNDRAIPSRIESQVEQNNAKMILLTIILR